MTDNMVGWILLSIVLGMAKGQEVTLGKEAILTIVGFMLISLTIGGWGIGHIFDFVQNNLKMPDKILSLIVMLMFIWGAIGNALGIEALLGAFVIGIIFSQIPQLDSATVDKLKSISLGVFTPVFFAVSGLKVDILGLLKPQTLAVAFLFIGIAITCKIVGVYLGARLIGENDHWTALFYGAGLNARSSMEIVVANIGFSMHILSQEMFSIIVVMALITSLMSPIIMRVAVRHIDMRSEDVSIGTKEKILLPY